MLPQHVRTHAPRSSLAFHWHYNIMPRSECGAAPEADGCWRRALKAPTHRSLDVACAHSYRMRDRRAKAEADALPAGDRDHLLEKRRAGRAGAVWGCAHRRLRPVWVVQWRLAPASTRMRRLELSLSAQLQENLPVKSPSLVQSNPQAVGVVPVEGSWSCFVFPNSTVPSAGAY